MYCRGLDSCIFLRVSCTSLLYVNTPWGPQIQYSIFLKAQNCVWTEYGELLHSQKEYKTVPLQLSS